MSAVSVVVCTKDRPELLAPCLRSIDAALAGLDGELVVVEAGDSGAAAAIADLDCPTRLITGARAGKSRQLNDGIRASDGEILVLTDDDCWVDPTWVKAMSAAFDDPRVGAAFSAEKVLRSVAGDELPPLLPGPTPAVTWASRSDETRVGNAGVSLVNNRVEPQDNT